MKRFIYIFAVTSIIALSSCGGQNTTSQDGTATDGVVAETGAEAKKPEKPKEMSAQDAATIKVVSKQNVAKNPNNGVFSDRVNLVFEVTNNSDKPIKGVAGVLNVNDMFDKPITSSNCNFTGKVIEPGTTVTFDELGFDINEFMEDDVKFYNETYENLKFTYDVNKVVYYDANATNETVNKAPNDAKVNVSVTAKDNIQKDIYNGIYSPRTEFDFVITNLTDKEIKGVQGIMTISDIFGNVIKKSNCDFTEKVIPAKGNVTIENLGFDINEFMSDDVLLYSTEYNDLAFEYETTAIVYTDGTTE